MTDDNAHYPENITNIMNIITTFHSPIKIRKYLRLTRNSRILSPALLSSSPNVSPLDFFLSLKFRIAQALIKSVQQIIKSDIILRKCVTKLGIIVTSRSCQTAPAFELTCTSSQSRKFYFEILGHTFKPSGVINGTNAVQLSKYKIKFRELHTVVSNNTFSKIRKVVNMASKGYSTIQLLDDEEESDEEILNPAGDSKDLKFQDFSSDLPEQNLSSSAVLQNDNDDDEVDDDEQELLSRSTKQPSFWTFEYYQSFFDVDTEQVLYRMAYSMIPRKDNYLLTRIRPNPDLYGPFWICATLVFTIAICGNLSSFFASEGGTQWKSDFNLVSLSACVIYSYGWIVPGAVWAFFLWRGNLAGFTFFEIVCVYGYSLAVFIPISIMWVVPYDWLRWIFVLIGVISSGSVLGLTFWRAVEDDSRKVATFSILTILVLHTTLAIGFKMYFFKSIKIMLPMPMEQLFTTITPTTPNTTTS